MLVQQLVNGALASGIYALFAVGFSIVFGVMGVLNMAHADFAMVAAFLAIWSAGAGFGPAVATLLAIAGSVVVAIVLESCAIRPARRFGGDAGVELPLIATLGCGLVLQNGVALLFGNKAVLFPINLRGYLHVGGLLVSQPLLVSAAVAGLLVGLSYQMVSPYVGLSYTIKGLIAMIVGGVGSVSGAALGALVIRLTEAVTVMLWGTQLRDLSVFAVLLAVLLLRPGGLLKNAARG